MISGLFAEKGEDKLDIFTGDEMYYFMEAQNATLKGIIGDIDAYHNEQLRQEDANTGMDFSGDMFVDLLNSCGGAPVAEGKIDAIADKLTDWAMRDTNGGMAAKAYFAALRRAGWDVVQTIKNGCATWSYSLQPDAAR